MHTQLGIDTSFVLYGYVTRHHAVKEQNIMAELVLIQNTSLRRRSGNGANVPCIPNLDTTL
jgi:hypothetical protein